MSEPLAAVLPLTTLQTCIVHLIRHSLDSPVRAIAGSSRPPTPSASSRVARGGIRFPTVSPPGVARGPRSSRFLPSTRRPAGDLHDECARERDCAGPQIIKTRGHFPNDEAATELSWLALRNITARWGGKASNCWHLAVQRFAQHF